MINKNHVLNDPHIELTPGRNNYPNVKHLHRVHPQKQLTVTETHHANWLGTHRTMVKKQIA